MPYIGKTLKPLSLTNTLTLIIPAVLLLIALLLVFAYKKIRLKASERDQLRNPNLPNASAGEHSIRLACMDIKNLYLWTTSVCWTLILVSSFFAISGSHTLTFAPRVKAVLSYLTEFDVVKFSPLIFPIILLYLIYSRKQLVWQKGLLIAFQPADIVTFEVKRLYKSATYLYLRSKNKTWVLAPATLEESKKFSNPIIMREQVALNEIEVEKLRQNLLQSGAVEARFRLIPGYLTVALLALLIFMIFLMSIYTY